jgi:hypothetical protein
MSKSNGSIAGRIILWSIGAAVAGFVIHSIPDIVRYMKIRAM